MTACINDLTLGFPKTRCQTLTILARFTPILRSSFHPSLSLSLAIDVKTTLGRLGIRRPPQVGIVPQPVRHLVSRIRVGTYVAIVARIDRAKNKAGRMRRGGRREEERKRGYRTRGTCPMALLIRVGRDRIWKFVRRRAKGF